MAVTAGKIMADPVQGLGLIRQQSEETQEELLETGANSLRTAEDTRAYAAAVISWPSESARRRAMEPVIEKLLQHSDFPSIAAWLDALPDATQARKNDARLALVTVEINAPDMPRRTNWVMSAAGTGNQPQMAEKLTEAWVAEDHNAAGVWLNENRSAPWYDAGAKSFSACVAGKEPATAFDWTLTISDESVRRAALKDVMTRWHRDDAVAAEDYLKKSALPTDWKTELSAAGKAE